MKNRRDILMKIIENEIRRDAFEAVRDTRAHSAPRRSGTPRKRVRGSPCR